MSAADAMPSGRVLQVSVSAGGVPKLPVERAWVGRLGLAGDAHRDDTVHGGPHRAVCLFGIEAIERLQSEGHPVEPGSVGENLTTSGIEWSLLPIGTRIRIGTTLELELASSTTPCATQRLNFSDGKFSRISIALHPSDSRMYARVIREGEVKPGDPIELQSAAAESRAQDELILDELDWAVGKSTLAEWRILRDLGVGIDIVDDGELIMGAAQDASTTRDNHAFGLARLPNLVSRAQAFYDSCGVEGCLITDEPPWPGATSELTVDVMAGAPADVAHFARPDGLHIERLTTANLDDWLAVRATMTPDRLTGVGDSREFATALATAPHIVVLVATLNGAPAGTAWLWHGHQTEWLRGAGVVPEFRGRGIHSALIAARAQAAAELGCELIGAWAATDSTSARNLAALGLRRIGTRQHYRYLPAQVAAATAS